MNLPRPADIIDQCQCMKSRGQWTCALPAGHKGPCGFTKLQREKYTRRDMLRGRPVGSHIKLLLNRS